MKSTLKRLQFKNIKPQYHLSVLSFPSCSVRDLCSIPSEAENDFVKNQGNWHYNKIKPIPRQGNTNLRIQ